MGWCLVKHRILLHGMVKYRDKFFCTVLSSHYYDMLRILMWSYSWITACHIQYIDDNCNYQA
jgi:hypothetical protein